MLVLIVLYINIFYWSIIRLLCEFLLFVFWLVLDIQELVEQEEKKEALCVVDLTGDKHDIVSDDSLLDDIIDITDEVWYLLLLIYNVWITIQNYVLLHGIYRYTCLNQIVAGPSF